MKSVMCGKLSVRRPIELVVLNCCVTETNDIPCASKSSTSRAKSASERVSRSTLYTTTISMRPARISVSKALRRGSLEIAAREPAIVIAGSGQQPTLVLLAANVGLAGFALRRERIEFLLQPFLGGFAGVDRATSAARVSSRHRRPRRLNGVPARA